ncbi:hypothetical protein [Draconibacterium sp.]|uniref:hypothetical protein n=1 Tax=Draconibacterium sp. TaxID=1965318 RepID=UPI003562098F
MYSHKIDDPSFDKYIRNSQKWKFQFSLIIAAMVITGFFLYGAFSDEMDNPEALQIGLGIGLMFVVVGFFSGLSKQKRSWDGTVVNKKTKIVLKDIGYQGSKAECIVYTVYIKSETGKVHEIRSENDATLFNYYQIGERVRWHERLKSYEKFDKSGDTIIFCNACAFMHSIEENTCRNCGCPLLK